MAEVEGAVVALTAQGAAGNAAERSVTERSVIERSVTLANSWARLSKLIALEPEPELRTCPHCGQRVMRVATRCLHCWKRSEAGGPTS
jgi:hypothetical protein